MNQNKIAAFLTTLGAHNIAIGDEWVKASCPFAPFLHGSGTDRNPSFGIKIEPTGRSHFNCMACHKKGDLDDLLIELMHFRKQNPECLKGLNFPVAHAMLEQENDELYYDHSEAELQKVEFEAWPDWYLDAFPAALQVTAASNYLVSRGFTENMIKAFDVRFDQFKQRVVFPFRNSEGELAGLRGRSILPHAKRPHFDYRFNGRSNIGYTWANEHKCITGKPVVVTEGYFDVAAVTRVYSNVVACLSSGASYQKLDRLLYYPVVVFMYDADKAGKQASDTQWAYLKKKGAVTWVVPYTTAHFANEVDPAKLAPSEIRSLLDHYVPLA